MIYLRLAITFELECVQVNLTHGSEELDDALAAAGQILDVNQVEATSNRSVSEVREVPIDVRAVVVLAELAHLRTIDREDGNHALVRQVRNLHLVGQSIALVGVVSIVRIGHHGDEVEVAFGLLRIVLDQDDELDHGPNRGSARRRSWCPPSR